MASYTPPDPPYFTDINFNPSFYNTITGAFITAAQASAKYLNKITGGTITGLVKIIYSSITQVQLQIQNTNSTAVSSVLIVNDNNTQGLVLATYGTANTTNPYLSGKPAIVSTDNISLITGNSSTTPALQILANRNVGLGITNPTALLHLHNPTASGETRISFSDTSSGTTITDGFAIIKEAGEDVAIWNYENNAIRFGTNNIERLRIVNDGNVGIGTSDPGTYRLRIRGAANNTFLRIETPNNLAFETSGIEFGIPNFTSSGTAKITSMTGIGDINNLQFLTSSGANSSSVKMTILGNGNIGMGTDNPQSRLHLHNTGNSQDIQIRLTDGSTGIGATDGAFIQKTSLQDMFLGTLENARLYAFTNNAVRLAIQANGYTCIVDGNNQDVVNNIFQVGDGSKLRISNGANDYSLIGTKSPDDGTNTRIVVSGNARSGLTGYIEYISTTAAGVHRFQNNGNVTLNISDTSVTFSRPLSITDNPVYVLGQSLGYTTKTNTALQNKSGYFIILTNLLDASIHIAASHNSTSYTYWHGNVSTNSVGGVITINPTAQSFMNMEAFQENGTNSRYLYMVPNTSYNTAVNLKIRYFG